MWALCGLRSEWSADLVAVFVGEIDAEAFAGPEMRLPNGVANDVLPPFDAPFLGGIEAVVADVAEGAADVDDDLLEGEFASFAAGNLDVDAGDGQQYDRRHHRADHPPSHLSARAGAPCPVPWRANETMPARSITPMHGGVDRQKIDHAAAPARPVRSSRTRRCRRGGPSRPPLFPGYRDSPARPAGQARGQSDRCTQTTRMPTRKSRANRR